MAVDAGVLDAKHPIAKHFEMAADCDCARESDVGVSLDHLNKRTLTT